jgi:hypothetical protein
MATSAPPRGAAVQRWRRDHPCRGGGSAGGQRPAANRPPFRRAMVKRHRLILVAEDSVEVTTLDELHELGVVAFNELPRRKVQDDLGASLYKGDVSEGTVARAPQQSLVCHHCLLGTRANKLQTGTPADTEPF